MVDDANRLASAPAGVAASALDDVLVWPAERDPDNRFVPVVELARSGLAERIAARVGGAPLRMGQSAVVMGVASRLWSLTVVPAVTHDVLLDLDGLVAADDDGAVTLGLRGPARGWLGPTVDNLDAVIHAVLDPVVAEFRLSRRLLWGNVASSLHAVPRAHALPRARPLVDQLLSRAPYAGELDETRGVRRTCCLFYLAPGAGYCGDCPLPTT